MTAIPTEKFSHENFSAPTLHRSRLTLRLPREADFAAMLAFNATPRTEFIGGPLDRRWTWRGLLANIGHWALRGYGLFSVETKAGDSIDRIGVIRHDGWPEPELNWRIFVEGEGEGEGKGFARKAALAAKADYHARISSTPLISMITPANVRSIALAKRLGAVFERSEPGENLPYDFYRHTAPEAEA